MSYADQDFEKTAASHTPGPWTTHADAPFEVVMDDGDVNPLIATVNACSASVDRPQALADARLIAAAPDLLAALEALTAWAERMGGWDASCWRDAEAAIARATGRPE